MISHKYSIVLRCALVLVGMFAIGGAVVGQDRVILVDLGINIQKTTSTGWNNFFGVAGDKPTSTLALNDAIGTATGITMVPTWSALNDNDGINTTAANYDGPYPTFPAWIPPPPQSALRDGLYVRDGESLTLTLNNLPAGKTYNFSFYGAAGNTGDYSLFTASGGNIGQAHITPLVNNSTTIAQINGIVPDATQKISLLFEGRRPDGSVQNPGISGDGLGRFNFLGIAQFATVNGDYNGDLTANAADYGVWKTNFGSTSNLAADGSHNSTVDAADYVVWRKASESPFVIPAVPEPASAALFVMALVSLCSLCRTARRSRYSRQ